MGAVLVGERVELEVGGRSRSGGQSVLVARKPRLSQQWSAGQRTLHLLTPRLVFTLARRHTVTPCDAPSSSSSSFSS